MDTEFCNPNTSYEFKTVVGANYNNMQTCLFDCVKRFNSIDFFRQFGLACVTEFPFIQLTNLISILVSERINFKNTNDLCLLFRMCSHFVGKVRIMVINYSTSVLTSKVMVPLQINPELHSTKKFLNFNFEIFMIKN